MKTAIDNWTGKITVDGLETTISKIDFNSLSDTSCILLHSRYSKAENEAHSSSDSVYRIKVRQYMTRPSTPDFDFMQRFNNNNPMPYRIMIGTKLQETKGMVYMKLHADVPVSKSNYCMKCGRQLTNDVSKYFGIGPECGNHNYINPFESDSELKAAVAEYSKQLQAVTWEGWIIKSAIEEQEVIE